MRVLAVVVLWVIVVTVAFVDPLFAMVSAFCAVPITDEILKS